MKRRQDAKIKKMKDEKKKAKVQELIAEQWLLVRPPPLKVFFFLVGFAF